VIDLSEPGTAKLAGPPQDKAKKTSAVHAAQSSGDETGKTKHIFQKGLMKAALRGTSASRIPAT
jgi:hypothetical protein